MVILRYIAGDIVRATLFILVALLALFAFYDLFQQLPELGRGNYRLRTMIAVVLLNIPGHTHVVLPVSAMMGTLVVLARMSEQSELTVLRASGLSLARLAGGVAAIGLGIGVITFAISEFVAPSTDEMAKALPLQATSALNVRQFRSGFWVKDGRRFVNIQDVRTDGGLEGVKIYSFSAESRLESMLQAANARFATDAWELRDVTETEFVANGPARLKKHASLPWKTALTPGIITNLKASPDDMSIVGLNSYIRHLRANNQQSTRYEIAFWSRVLYPGTVIVMMLLALPFAIHQARRGGLGAKVALGIMIGVSFDFLARLFASVGQLNAWSPVPTAIAPPLLFLAFALAGLYIAERR